MEVLGVSHYVYQELLIPMASSQAVNSSFLLLAASGHREEVDQETLNTAARFAKYAIAAYGKFGLDYKDENGYASWPNHSACRLSIAFASLQ